MSSFNDVEKEFFGDEKYLEKLSDIAKYATVNGRCWKRDEHGKWIRNDEAQQRRNECLSERRERQKHKEDLLFALRTRVLTDAEMLEVQDFGINLILRDHETYKEADKQIELNIHYAQQFRLRACAAEEAQYSRIAHAEG